MNELVIKYKEIEEEYIKERCMGRALIEHKEIQELELKTPNRLTEVGKD